MTKRLVVICILIIGLGVGAGFALQNELFLVYLLWLTTLNSFWIGLLVVGVIALIEWAIRRRLGGIAITSAVLYAACFASVFVLMRTGFGINEAKVRAVNQYVNLAAVVLDKIKTRDGRYPSNLPVSELGEPPSLLKEYGQYHSDGGAFSFEYVNEPAGWAGGEGALIYKSTDRRWREE